VFDHALEECPPSYGLYMGAAAAIWHSDTAEPARSEGTIALLQRALEHGGRVENVRQSYPLLANDSRFAELVQRKWEVKPVRPVHISDPLGEFPARYPALAD
jgi:hypothetical protein